VYPLGGGYRVMDIPADVAGRYVNPEMLTGFHAWTDEVAMERHGAGEPYEERDA
jgi:hypothetical protein